MLLDPEEASGEFGSFYFFREFSHDNPAKGFVQLNMNNIPLFFPVPGRGGRQTKPASQWRTFSTNSA
jgi:hypothetical protein